MRLSKIKLSGFKTFVDTTSLDFPSNLTGIVGPNGCGKSNIIDAIRWVMGESSARNLRGDTMDDVIFSGSSSRSEVSHASIELLFDNSSNKLDSKFAKFNEIVIRREANRDGTSSYYLNNTRCRRKDIREVFLGTGLGPRSYAIIEQGMISKIIDSKPEELRTFLEEAAGISKYKEKRRETELRLKHTSDNLSRLNDIMKEINSSLTKLQKQANDAELYKSLKKEEEDLRVEIVAKKIINYDDDLDSAQKKSKDYLLEKDKYDSIISGFNSKIEKSRLSRDNEQEKYNKTQSQSFHIAAEIARAEKDIEYTQQIETSKQDNINDINKDIERIQNEVNDLKSKEKFNESEIDKSEQEKRNLDEKIKDIDIKIKDTVFSLQNWQSNYNTFLSERIELEKKIELEKSKIESYIDNINNLEKRLSKYKDVDDEKAESTVQIELLDISEKYQKKLINFKVDFDRHLKNTLKGNNETLNIFLNKLIDEFKQIIIKIKQNNKSIIHQIREIEENTKLYKEKIIKSEEILIKYNSEHQNYEKQKNTLEKQKIDLKQNQDKLNWKYNELTEKLNSNNVKITTFRTEILSFSDNLGKCNADINVLTSKKQELLSNEKQPTKSDSNKLNKLLNNKKEKDQELVNVQNKIISIENDIKNNENQIRDITDKQKRITEDIGNINVELAEIKTNKSSLLENSDLDKDLILAAIRDIDDELLSDKEKSLSNTKSKIEKLGAINLAAIDELKEYQDRKVYLDKQYNDITQSVETLENAIKKIDSETKSKFKETFDAINKNLSYFFPKIFGGGKSYLELTNNDLLNTGVNIMAKPPGKLVKNLNLLSGGEKAGTGIAFVFSIFRINPAPFCLLDEVDAPLDEANNARFCSVVKEMSQTVQFIFITHNKSTMQMADVLSGVTMREAGVSKLVSVNVDDAVKMASDN